jgi:hypothetical protein
MSSDSTLPVLKISPKGIKIQMQKDLTSRLFIPKQLTIVKSRKKMPKIS